MEIGTNFGRQLDDLAFAGSQRVDTPDLTQQDFLKLMIEQMRNQNPLDPQNNNDFFTQMTQFNTLDTMQEIAASLRSMAEFNELANASALVGRTITVTVTALDPETGEVSTGIVVGVVERVTFGPGGPMAYVGDSPVPTTSIVEVA